jgi:Pyridoxamine 5'-phosphate oxidase
MFRRQFARRLVESVSPRPSSCSTITRRQKARNLARDPRISVSVVELENPYDSVQVRGAAELVEDTGRTPPKVLSRKYLSVRPR